MNSNFDSSFHITYLVALYPGKVSPRWSCFSINPDTDGTTPIRTSPTESIWRDQFGPAYLHHSQHSATNWNFTEFPTLYQCHLSLASKHYNKGAPQNDRLFHVPSPSMVTDWQNGCRETEDILSYGPSPLAQRQTLTKTVTVRLNEP